MFDYSCHCIIISLAPPGTSVSDGQGRAGWQTEKDVVWDEIVVNNKLVWLEINIYNIACPVAINIGPSSPSPSLVQIYWEHQVCI